MKVRNIGPSKQLFIDDYIVEEIKNVSKTLNQAKKHPNNPLIVADRSWEDFIQCYGTVLYDEKQKLFRMWCYGGPTGSLYATSKDGLKWEKPSLGLYEFEGSKENNIVPNGPTCHFMIYNPEMHILRAGDDYKVDTRYLPRGEVQIATVKIEYAP